MSLPFVIKMGHCKIKLMSAGVNSEVHYCMISVITLELLFMFTWL